MPELEKGDKMLSESETEETNENAAEREKLRIDDYLSVKWYVLAIIALLVTAERLLGVIGNDVFFMNCAGVAMAALTALFLKYYLNNDGKAYSLFTHISLISDMVIICVFLYLTGGPENIWGFLPLLTIFVSGYLFNLGWAIGYAFISFVMVTGLFFLDVYAVIPHYSAYHASYAYWKNWNYLGDYIFGMVLLYFSGAMISGVMYQSMRKSAARMEASLAESRQARKEAEDARFELERILRQMGEINDKKTEFVSDVSHELRTPLASIKGFISTIRSEKEMDEKNRDEFMKIVEDETDRLTRIIEELLDLSRIESGRLKLNLKSFRLIDTIHKNIENIQGQAKKKEIIIEKRIPPDLPPVYADQDKTTQVIINLLSNAVKYNRKGGKVTVSAFKDDGRVKVAVEDTGVGISEKDIPHMFEKFYRADKTSSDAPGTGLGLALSKSLIEVQGGEMSVFSEVDKGSTFFFTLPVSDNKAAV